MQQDMLQDDLFSDLQDTEQDATPKTPPADPSTTDISKARKPIDLTTAQITPARAASGGEAKESESTSDNTQDESSDSKVVEQEIPSTATLLEEEPAGSSPIGAILPVLSEDEETSAAPTNPTPKLESDDDKQVDIETLISEKSDQHASEEATDHEVSETDDTDVTTKTTKKDTSGKAPGAFKTISEAANFLGVPQHVLRFWESRFSQIKPLKMRGGRRYYRPEDMEVLSTIQHLLYKQGYTIKGAKKVFSTRNKNALEAAQRDIKGLPPKIETNTGAVKAKSDTNIKPSKPILDDRKKKQLSSIRNELLGLRESLSTYLA